MAMPALESLMVDDSTNDTIQTFSRYSSPYPAVRSLKSASRFLRDKRHVTSLQHPLPKASHFTVQTPTACLACVLQPLVVNGVVVSLLIHDCPHPSANRYTSGS